MNEVEPKHKFEALDGWRGISALMIVFYHFHANMHLRAIPFIGSAYLFVDFFFVLSGFVIAFNYKNKLRAGYPLGNFIFLRLGRIYPLHLFMIVLLVLFSFVKYAFEGNIPFSKDEQSIGALISSLTLTQGLGFYDHLVWNRPAWSISVEFFAYLVFAGGVLFLRNRFLPAATALFVCLTLIFGLLRPFNQNMSLFFPRCLYGFCAGVLCQSFYQKYRRTFSGGRAVFNGIEFMGVAGMMVFMAFSKGVYFSFLSPYVFSIILLIFSLERGFISDLLKSHPFKCLGLWSYSIYMTHTFIQGCFYSGLRIAEKFTHVSLHYSIHEPDDNPLIGHLKWQGDVAAIIMAGAVIGFSCLTYRLIEKPANEWARAHYK